MGQRIDQFSEDLRLKLTKIDSTLDGVKAKIDGKGQNVDQTIRGHLEEVQRHIEQDRAKVSAAQVKVDSWVANQKIATATKVADWKANRELSKLQNRANDAEQYAAAALDIALAAVDDAEQATLEAWLARQDADFAQAQKTASPVR